MQIMMTIKRLHELCHRKHLHLKYVRFVRINHWPKMYWSYFIILVSRFNLRKSVVLMLVSLVHENF